MHDNSQRMRGFFGIGAVAAILLAVGGGIAVLADSSPDEARSSRHGKVKIVTEGEDGERHERVIVLDGDGPRAFLGVSVESRSGDGVTVEKVFDDSSAQRAGIEKGDVILRFDGATIDTPWDLTERVLESKPGERVELQLLRDGKELELEVELGERDDWVGPLGLNWDEKGFEQAMEQWEKQLEHLQLFKEQHLLDKEQFGLDKEQLEDLRKELQELDLKFEVPDVKLFGLPHGSGLFWSGRPKLGVQLIEATPELREQMGAPADAGVLVSKVLADMPAERADIRVGDVIVALDDKRIEDSGDLVEALHDKHGETVRIKLIRDRRALTLDVFIPDREELEDRPTGPRA